MKFPSVQHVFTNAKKTFERFWLPLLIAIAATVVCITIIEKEDLDNTILTRLVYTCAIGLPLSIGCFLYAERSMGKYGKWIASLFAILCMTAYGIFFAPEYPFQEYRVTLIFFVLIIVMHLWVSFSPYVGKNDMNGFWRFNESLFARIIISGIFSAVLFAGLSLAIAAIDILFKYDVNEKIYGELWITIVGVFNTWFLLSGIPVRFEELGKEKEFPKGLKIFSQYILIPLATIYLVILYAYSIKILVQWSLPKGWVSMLIMGYSVVGILAILLVNPLRDDKDNAWVRIFSRFFFIALLPLIVLLYVAIGARVGQYGITELRYCLVVLGAWLAFISLYHVFSKKKNIKLIPVTLAIMGLLTLWGPWSVFNISKHSQVNRLEKLLAKNEIWHKGGKIEVTKKIVPKKDREEIQNIIEYIVEREQTDALQHIYNVDLQKIKTDIAAGNKRKDYYPRWDNNNKMTDTLITMLHIEPIAESIFYNKSYNAEDDEMNISGYNNMHFYVYSQYNDNGDAIVLPGDDSLKVVFTNTPDAQHITIERKGEKQSKLQLEALLKQLENSTNQQSIPVKNMTVYSDNDSSCQLIIKHVDLTEGSDRDDKKVDMLEGYLLTK